MGIFGDFCIHQYRSQENEIPELGMNHVAMNPHLSEARRDRYRLVGDHPHFRSPTISLHRESNGSAIDRANPDLFQCRDDSAGHFVGFVRRVMEFEIGD